VPAEPPTLPPPPSPDELWIRLGPAWSADRTVRWRILGNGHTHRGRILVEPIGLDQPPTRISLPDVVECSPAARAWLEGFLAGQEPELYEFLGRDDRDEPPTDDEVDRWLAWNQRWRSEGIAPALRRLPDAAAVPADLGPPPAWTYNAGRYLLWSRQGWIPAEPQPRSDDPEADVDGWAWPGTVCGSRGTHDMDENDYGDVEICEDCHLVENA
jgi:hypothetical protein